MKLSILVPSIPSRMYMAMALQAKIEALIDKTEIEVLTLFDNKSRTIGEKRQALLDISRGEYVVWVDDDDDIAPEFFEVFYDAYINKPDLITYLHNAVINGRSHIIDVDVNHADEQLQLPVTRRKPLTASVWKRSIAIQGKFPASNYGEDAVWAQQIHGLVVNQTKYNKVLHKYIYNDSTTASVDIKHNMNKKTCIISFSSVGRENYNNFILGMIDSVRAAGLETDFIIYSPDHELEEYKGVTINKGFPPGCKPHSDVPYQFKPYLFKLAAERGYEHIIWMDSTVKMQQHPKKILDHIETNGVAVWDNWGHPLKFWIADKAVKNLGMTELELGICPQIMACVIAMDVTHEHTKKILEDWINISNDGESFQGMGDSVRPEYRGHRHDQAVLSYLVWKKQIPFIPYGSLCYPPHHESGNYEVIFLNKA